MRVTSNRYEETIARYASRTGGLATQLAQACGEVRREMEARTPAAWHGIVSVATGVASPLLVFYVAWCLERAQDADFEHLFFVSRDGQILLRIAEVLRERMAYRGTTDYLYSGRMAWIFPSLAPRDEDDCRRLAEYCAMLSTPDICRILRFDASQSLALERALGTVDPDDPWSESYRQEALASFLGESTIKRHVCQSLEEARKRLLRYFNEQGIRSGRPWGFVEIGWRGNIQCGVQRVIAGSDLSAPHGYYLGLAQERPDIDANLRRCYLFDAANHARCTSLVDLFLIPVEIFCAADHATVLDFVESKGRVMPRFLYDGQPPNAPWFALFRSAVLATARRIAALPGFAVLRSECDLRPCFVELMQDFWLAPTAGEARAFSEFRFERLSNTGGINLAHPFGIVDVVRAAKNGMLPKRTWGLERNFARHWQAGSLRISPAYVRRAMSLLGRRPPQPLSLDALSLVTI